MVDKKKLYESLDTFIDLVATENDGDRDILKEFINERTKRILEYTGDSKIKFDGDDVLVGGKVVGQVKIDHDDTESGINFVSSDGKMSKEFADMEALYGFLSDRFNVKEGVLDLSEGRVEDAVLKQKSGKSERAKRWSQVRNQVNKDSTPGDYEAGSTSEYDDSIKGKSDDAAYPHSVQKRHLRGYYDKADVRKQHKDPVRGGSEAAHAGVEADVKTSGGYDSHDVRKNHNS